MQFRKRFQEVCQTFFPIKSAYEENPETTMRRFKTGRKFSKVDSRVNQGNPFRRYACASEVDSCSFAVGNEKLGHLFDLRDIEGIWRHSPDRGAHKGFEYGDYKLLVVTLRELCALTAYRGVELCSFNHFGTK